MPLLLLAGCNKKNAELNDVLVGTWKCIDKEYTKCGKSLLKITFYDSYYHVEDQSGIQYCDAMSYPELCLNYKLIGDSLIVWPSNEGWCCDRFVPMDFPGILPDTYTQENLFRFRIHLEDNILVMQRTDALIHGCTPAVPRVYRFKKTR